MRRAELAPEVGGRVIDFYPTRAAAQFACEGWEIAQPDSSFEVRDGGSRWGAKGGRWLVVAPR